MKNKKFVAIIQARLTSKRFPGKVIQKIGKSSVLEVMLKRLRKSKKIDQIVVSIPANKKNKKLFEYLKKLDVKIFRGSENNVLDRFYKTAVKFKASDVIRITGDCPFIDPKIIDNLINLYSKKKKLTILIMQKHQIIQMDLMLKYLILEYLKKQN